MSQITGGEALARCLAQEGVRFVFGLPCPEIDPLLAALDGNGIRLVPVRHEAAGAHMAEGLYKTTGQVAAVLGNPGPGSANLIAGVITARHEGVPLVAITSQHRLGLVYPSPPTTFQGQDQLDVYSGAVKWGGPIFSWDRIGEVTRLAFREMWAGRPGPVQLEVPAPIMYETGEASALGLVAPERYRAGVALPSEKQLEQAADLLAGAERPLVFAGTGVDRAEANEALDRLVDRLGCPVIPSMAGRAVVPRDHAHFVMGYSEGGDAARREADVVLVVGSRLGNLDLPFDKYWGDPESQQIIQIDVDPRHLGASRPIDLGILADARAALEGLVAALEKRGMSREPSASLARYRELDQAMAGRVLQSLGTWQGEGIHPLQVMGAVGETFGRDAIYTVDGGNTSLWASLVLPPTRPRSYLSILELGMLGTGIPSALGAKLGNPDRDVVCVTGDGAAGFHFMEMQSAAREGIDFTTVVCAEGEWTMEMPNELMQWGKTFGTSQGKIRWDVVGEGLGCQGFYAEKPEEVAAAIQAAKAADGPAVVCVRTSKEANLALPGEASGRFWEVYQGPSED